MQRRPPETSSRRPVLHDRLCLCPRPDRRRGAPGCHFIVVAIVNFALEGREREEQTNNASAASALPLARSSFLIRAMPTTMSG